MECFKDILITIKTFQSKNRGQKSNVKKARKMLDEIIKIFYQSKTEFSYYKEIEEIVTNINLLYQDYCVTFGMISRKEFILQTEFDMKINLWGKGPKDSASIEGKILILKDKLIELLNREYKPKDELEEDNSKVIAKFDIDKYSYPPINSKEVGITIRNLGNFDLTDLHIRLIELKRLQVISRFEDRSILIRINNNNIDFNLGNDLVVPDKRTIIFGKFSNNRFMILVKESLNPDNLFKKQNPNIKMPNAVWFIKFEISGNIQGKKFRTETFSAQINVVNKVAEIGDIIHVEQDAEKQ